MNHPRLFNTNERLALGEVAQGKCSSCGTDLPRNFHADHVVPHSAGGSTTLLNGQALCPACNLAKGDKLPDNPPRGRELRTWQKNCLAAQIEAFGKGQRDFVVGAGVGAGKTHQALTLARHGLDAGWWERVVVLTHTVGIGAEWAKAASQEGIRLEERATGSDLRKDALHGQRPGFDGYLLSNGTLANAFPSLKKLIDTRATLVICDEVHHLGEGKSWEQALVNSTENAVFRLGLSGTPSRTDNAKIALLRYLNYGTEGTPCFSYSYGEALADGCVAPIAFRVVGGTINVTYRNDDEPTTETFARDYGGIPGDENRRLRLFVEQCPDWQANVLDTAHEHLLKIRDEDQYQWAGLAVFSRIEGAEAAAADFRKRHPGQKVHVVVGDDINTGTAVAAFNASNAPWMFAVGKITEGVNVPRFRVLTYLSTVVTSNLFFTQTWGRLVRLEPGFDQDEQMAVAFIPADPRLCAHAAEIREMVRHHLGEVEDEDVERAHGHGEGDDLPLDEPEFDIIHDSRMELDGLIVDRRVFSEEEIAAAWVWAEATFGKRGAIASFKTDWSVTLMYSYHLAAKGCQQ